MQVPCDEEVLSDDGPNAVWEHPIGCEKCHGTGMIERSEPDQTDLGASDDRPLGPDHPIYRQG